MTKFSNIFIVNIVCESSHIFCKGGRFDNLYSIFFKYYMERWSLLLTCAKQPLLDVDHTDARLNLLTPRFISQKGRALPASTLEKKRLKYENKANRQYLIPEILDIHPIPGKCTTIFF